MRCYVFFRFVIVLTVIILAVCVFSIASADQISSVFSKSIPIIDLNTGVTNNQIFYSGYNLDGLYSVFNNNAY